MKKIVSFIAVAAAVLSLASCKQTPKKTPVTGAKYAEVTIDAPDLSGISTNGKEVLTVYKYASMLVDSIYAREQFYPADMTLEEFEAFQDPDKNSPYTILVRDEEGKLKTVWYHDAYAAEIEQMSKWLQAAADFTIKPSVREYLLKKMAALHSDDYYESELAWLDMSDSKMDLIIGPDECVKDTLLGLKNSYEAFVLLKDLEFTEMLRTYASNLDSLQQSLPCPAEYKTLVPGAQSDIIACNALYYGGSAADGVKVIGINLPFNEKVQAEKGARSIIFPNVIEAKFNKILSPVAGVVIDPDQLLHVDKKAFYWNTVFREVAHGLGVKETVNGKGSVTDALGSYAASIEEIKAYVLGVYFAGNLGDAHKLKESVLTTRSDTYVTFLANVIRSARFGQNSKMGRANVAIYNYLAREKAFRRSQGGKYVVNEAKMKDGLAKLAGELLTIQANGDQNAAKVFMEYNGGVSRQLEEDFMNLRLEHIPSDIEFVYNY